MRQKADCCEIGDETLSFLRCGKILTGWVTISFSRKIQLIKISLILKLKNVPRQRQYNEILWPQKQNWLIKFQFYEKYVDW